MTMPDIETSTVRMHDMPQLWLPVLRIAPENPKALSKEIVHVAHALQGYDLEKLQQFVLDHYSKQVVADVVKRAYFRAIAQKTR
jgi:hypothetical protein